MTDLVHTPHNPCGSVPSASSHGPRRALVLLALALVALGGPAVGLPAAPPLPEAARWLQGYLRIDTTNPPGREAHAAAYLARILHREGIPTRTYHTPEGRASLYARLPATEPGTGGEPEALLLLHHMDVVPPGPGWSRDPFAAEVADGRLWGRGAVDTKGLGVAFLSALVELKRSGVPRHRDVVYLAVADEETGGSRGTEWLLAEYPELFEDVSAVLNEGGINLVTPQGLAWWGVEVAQKRPFWLEVVARGKGGHGSGTNPWNPVHRLVRGLAAVLDREPRWRVTEPVRAYLAALAPLHQGIHREVFEDPDTFITESGPATMLLPGRSSLFLDSLHVTMLEGSERINVVPPEARARLDVRLLPDTDSEAFLAELKSALGAEDVYVDVEVLLASPPVPPSPVAHPAYRLLEEVLGGEGPVVPAFIPGFTDSRYFRLRGIPAYGIAPFALESRDLQGIHGADERIPVEEFTRGVERLRRVVKGWVTADAE